MHSNTKFCPHCGVLGNIIRWGINRQKRFRFKCKSCNKTFCNRTNTFRFRTKLSDSQWYSLPQLLSLRTHPSGADLGRLLNKSPSTGQRILRRIRQNLPEATSGIISGIAELDETTFAGQWIGGAKQRKGILKLSPLQNRGIKTMNNFADQLVAPQVTVFTDEWTGYLEIGLKRPHYTVCHAKEFVSRFCRKVHTNSIEGVWGHAKPKAWHTYRRYPKIPDFLREICFHFNFNYTERCKYLTAQFSRPCQSTNTR